VLDVDLLGVVAVPWILTALTAGAVLGLARRFAIPGERVAVLLLCVPLGNTAFLGYPMTRALVGEEALPYAVLYDQFGTFLLLSTWGLWVLARYGGDPAPTVSAIVAKVVRFPPFVALVVALTLMPSTPHPVVAVLLERLSDALLPIVAFAVGFELRFRLPGDTRVALVGGLTAKLALLPLVALGLSRLLGLDGAEADAVVLESAMPPMVSAGALAMSHRLAPGLAAALVGYGTLLGFATLWAWSRILGG
jgi:predicted permease